MTSTMKLFCFSVVCFAAFVSLSYEVDFFSCFHWLLSYKLEGYFKFSLGLSSKMKANYQILFSVNRTFFTHLVISRVRKLTRLFFSF
jgi:hypothetical protein